MTKMNNMEELTKQLENTRNFVFYCPDDRDAIEKAIEYLKQYNEIKNIVEHWNDTSSNFVSACTAFEKILDVFKG